MDVNACPSLSATDEGGPDNIMMHKMVEEILQANFTWLTYCVRTLLILFLPRNSPLARHSQHPSPPLLMSTPRDPHSTHHRIFLPQICVDPYVPPAKLNVQEIRLPQPRGAPEAVLRLGPPVLLRDFLPITNVGRAEAEAKPKKTLMR